MLGVETLSAGWKALLFGAATVLFVIAYFVPKYAPLAAALFTSVFFWDALVAA